MKAHLRRALADREILASAALLLAVLIVGLATAGDYGITVDEFIFDPYGPQALAWYASGFSDRTLFQFYDVAYYGPWFQMLVALAQKTRLADPFAVRHAVTFAVGLAGLAALVPIGRLAVGRWAGFIALVLCLTTGNIYGHLFFTPNDVPFMAAMMWATLAIMVMARESVPHWRPTIIAGLLTGLAIATRFGGVLAQAYLAGAMVVCAFQVMADEETDRRARLIAIAVRAIVAILVGWIAAIVLWPWLQVGNPFTQYKAVYDYFIRSYVVFDFPSWGVQVSSGRLPWWYIPGELAARLPELFFVLLAIASVGGVVIALRFVRDASVALFKHRFSGILVQLAEARLLLIVAAAALAPPLFIVWRGSVIFDALRHVFFVLPLLAVLAAWALYRLKPVILRYPVLAAAIAALHIAMTVPAMIALHPLEYIAMNSFAGGVSGAYGRFALDYWLAAAGEAVRRLDARVAANPGPFASRLPRVHVCIPWREAMTAPMLPKGWTVELDRSKADFVIETERSHCGADVKTRLIDEVIREGRPFAWTLAVVRGP